MLPLGMANSDILDKQITVSSQRTGHPSVEARLQSANGWCAGVTDKNQFLQIDLGQVTRFAYQLTSFGLTISFIHRENSIVSHRSCSVLFVPLACSVLAVPQACSVLAVPQACSVLAIPQASSHITIRTLVYKSISIDSTFSFESDMNELQ